MSKIEFVVFESAKLYQEGYTLCRRRGEGKVEGRSSASLTSEFSAYSAESTDSCGTGLMCGGGMYNKCEWAQRVKSKEQEERFCERGRGRERQKKTKVERGRLRGGTTGKGRQRHQKG
jgi:hypothetical protein